MEHLFGQDWEIYPAGGATGAAYLARHPEQKLFLKRNSSPFLAALSAERIVPKLVWTKRLENGDVITAQQWLNGRELEPAEMMDERVAKLLRKIHASTPLLGMLRRIGKSPLQPESLLALLEAELDGELRTLSSVQRARNFLKNEITSIFSNEKVVCHCDVNHNNWLLSDENELFLIDWDGAKIADPAIDLGLLLYSYIPRSRWEEWLVRYGVPYTEDLGIRMRWYVYAETIKSIQWHKKQRRLNEMRKGIQFLEDILTD